MWLVEKEVGKGTLSALFGHSGWSYLLLLLEHFMSGQDSLRRHVGALNFEEAWESRACMSDVEYLSLNAKFVKVCVEFAQTLK